jgi:hypothetical protein
MVDPVDRAEMDIDEGIDRVGRESLEAVLDPEPGLGQYPRVSGLPARRAGIECYANYAPRYRPLMWRRFL